LKKEAIRRILVLAYSSIALTAHLSVFAYTWYTYYAQAILYPFWYRGNLLLFALYVTILYISFRFMGGNRLNYSRSSDIIYFNWMSILLVNTIMFAQVSLIARQFVDVSPFVWMSFVQLVFAFLWILLSKKIYTSYFPPKKMLMIIGNPNSADLKTKLDIDYQAFDVAKSVYLSEGLEAILRYVDNYDDIIIADVDSKQRNIILKYCYQESKRVFMTPKISDIIIRGSSNIHLFDTPLLLANNRGLRYEERIIKRLVDLIGSSVGILLLSPLLILIAIGVKASDGGPALYTQQRLTRDGKVFEIFKFRSMRIDSEADNIARLAAKDDQRITPIGKLLRKSHFDELPQLFNILKGDMSIVGPRPERPDIAEQYSKVIPEFSYRLKVKAGLTGYAQVYGQYNTTPYDKLKLDLFYIENYSIIRDIGIILFTVKIMFQKEKSDGIDHLQITAIKEKNELND
jgi:exopolysaccharide biosynthesis polyprenyl glycosylphosphotransferase